MYSITSKNTPVFCGVRYVGILIVDVKLTASIKLWSGVWTSDNTLGRGLLKIDWVGWKSMQ